MMNKLLAPVIAGMTAFPLLAHAAAPMPILRGTVAAVADDSVTVQTNDGQRATAKLTPTTRFVQVQKSSLGAIDKNTFIGTATKDVGSRQIALEVVVFPNSMRGTGEGHYPWDALPDTTLGGGARVASSMTNGTVSTASGGTTPTKVNTAMTNGTVASNTGAAGAKELTVTYKGGEQHILVPPTAPIVTLAPGARTDVVQGAPVVVTQAKGGDNALSVLVGVGGVTPPM